MSFFIASTVDFPAFRHEGGRGGGHSGLWLFCFRPYIVSLLTFPFFRPTVEQHIFGQNCSGGKTGKMVCALGKKARISAPLFLLQQWPWEFSGRDIWTDGQSEPGWPGTRFRAKLIFSSPASGFLSVGTRKYCPPTTTPRPGCTAKEKGKRGEFLKTRLPSRSRLWEGKGWWAECAGAGRAQINEIH